MEETLVDFLLEKGCRIVSLASGLHPGSEYIIRPPQPGNPNAGRIAIKHIKDNWVYSLTDREQREWFAYQGITYKSWEPIILAKLFQKSFDEAATGH